MLFTIVISVLDSAVSASPIPNREHLDRRMYVPNLTAFLASTHSARSRGAAPIAMSTNNQMDFEHQSEPLWGLREYRQLPPAHSSEFAKGWKGLQSSVPSPLESTNAGSKWMIQESDMHTSDSFLEWMSSHKVEDQWMPTPEESHAHVVGKLAVELFQSYNHEIQNLVDMKQTKSEKSRVLGGGEEVKVVNAERRVSEGLASAYMSALDRIPLLTYRVTKYEFNLLKQELFIKVDQVSERNRVISKQKTGSSSRAKETGNGGVGETDKDGLVSK